MGADPITMMMVAQAANSLTQGYTDQADIKSQDRIQRAQAGIAQRRLGMQADDAIRRGDKSALKIRRDAASFAGSQRAAYAGQGVNPDAGSAAMIRAETELFGELDAQEVQNNAWRQAWGLKSEAEDIALESKWRTKASRRQRRATIATGGINAATAGIGAYGYSQRTGRQS